MADHTDITPDDDDIVVPPVNDEPTNNAPNPPVLTEEERIQKLVDERLKDAKAKLDAAYAARDREKERADQLAQEKRDAELARLEEEGKHQEVYNIRLQEETAKREAAERRNVELTRDMTLKDHLKVLTFRTDKASDMAYQEIVGQLVQNEQGAWVHRSGVSISDFVKTFSEDDNNAFLFKSKQSRGSGTSEAQSSNPVQDKTKSLFEMSTAEVLALAAEGKLPKRR
jgi:hypothetical protein